MAAPAFSRAHHQQALHHTKGRNPLDRVKARRGTIALSHQIIDFALHGPDGSPIRPAESDTLWTLVEQIFDSGENMHRPLRDGST